MRKSYILMLGALMLLVFNACQKENKENLYSSPAAQQQLVHKSTYANWPETFESGSKGAYAAADVNLATGTWNFDDALIGSLSNDRKNDGHSVRIRNTGKITMKFDLANGATQVNIQHAVYGSDASSSWQLWYSTNGGSSWSQAGSTINTTSTTLSTATFTLNISGNVRFEIRKLGGGRLNIDDFEVSKTTAYTGWPEAFELGSKGAYAAADVVLATGSWNFDDALIGSLSNDRKNDGHSVRIRNTGKITMKFDLSGGATDVSLQHAVYGSDASSTWQLWYSTDGGSSWIQAGSTVTTSSTALSAATFNLNVSGNVRFEIRKLSGGRLNIDDITINGSSSGGSGGSGGGSGTATRDDNMAMGNPSGATTNSSNSNNYLVLKTQYDLSYNNSRGTANWVSWHLSSAWTGSVSRCDCFSQDNTLPSGYFKATTSDYTNTGFNRGHMCPSADRNENSTDNAATFLMSNIMPQSPRLNQQTWANLESYCRTLTDNGYELYIISGGYGQGGTGSNGGTTNTIANGSITVPNRCWKVVLVLPNGSNDVDRVTTNTRVIAVDMPNDQTLSTSWGTYRTSVDAIESQTGYDFLSNVPVFIQSAIEAQVDNGPTQ